VLRGRPSRVFPLRATFRQRRRLHPVGAVP